MPCDNCTNHVPGAIIKVDKGRCAICGDEVFLSINEGRMVHKRWDKYFLLICESVASKSSCLSRQIGAVIVRDNSIVSTGYNGPARGYPHHTGAKCPRHDKGYKSGEGLHECPAGHAEVNAIANAARLGTNVSGCALYLNTNYPCKDCMITIVNAGIKEVIASIPEPYHQKSLDIAYYGGVKLRGFVL